MQFFRSLLKVYRPWRHTRKLATKAPPSTRETTRPGLGSYLLLVPSLVAGSLGVWQIQRSSWKSELVQRRESRLTGDPVDLLDPSLCPLEYTPTSATGKFQEASSVLVGPRVRIICGIPEKGFMLITPLKSSTWDRTILVNRGWVPESWKTNEKSAQDELSEEEVRVQGVVVDSEKPSSFIPDNHPAKSTWFWVDIPAIAAACGLPSDTPMIQAVRRRDDHSGYDPQPTPIEVLGGRTTMKAKEADYPIPKDVEDFLEFSVMPNDHLGYSAIWFSLSGATALMAARALRQGRWVL
ncbi:hypothetical protein BSKO_07246 [Bryopsis sp. KO-2023]|nr:hypothetical protein BSKO_07246 [Bryopsis sp. KO-2023]